MFDKGSLFTFQKHAWLQTLEAMPNVLGNINAISSFFLTQDDGLQDLALVIVGRHLHPTPQYHKSLVLSGMVMHWNLSARLQRIEETVAFVLKALMEVVVHPQPRRLLGLLRQIIH